MNGKLKSALVGAYILIIALLLLSNCRGCNRRPDPVPQQAESAEERAEQIGNDGEIKITLLWDFYGDVDLHVTEPNGCELWFSNMRDTETGGELDVDNRAGGPNSAENIYWSNPLSGRYTVELVMYRMDSRAPNGGNAKVVIKTNGQTETFDVRLSYSGERTTVKSFNYTPQ